MPLKFTFSWIFKVLFFYILNSKTSSSIISHRWLGSNWTFLIRVNNERWGNFTRNRKSEINHVCSQCIKKIKKYTKLWEITSWKKRAKMFFYPAVLLYEIFSKTYALVFTMGRIIHIKCFNGTFPRRKYICTNVSTKKFLQRNIL